MNFTRSELGEVARNGWAVADVPEEARSAALAEINRLCHSAPRP
jgi:hypothetical protein